MRAFPALLLLLAVAGCRADDGAAAPSGTEGGTAEPRDAAGAGGLRLALPTANRALLDGHPERFYMGLDRTVDSLRDARWEGGQYGFVRDPVPTPFGLRTFRRLHEGLDIAPMARDADGNPTDSVRAVADGRVAYVTHDPTASSYGRYVVVEHAWSGSPVFSLYAHLDTATVAAGRPVAQGAALGRMGFSGRGLRRDRAHVHLEIALLLNRRAQAWSDRYVPGPNVHGAFYGTNLAGVDPAALLLRLRDEPGLTFPDYVTGQAVGYTLDLPGGAPLDLLARYPWLGRDAARADPATVPAWRVALTAEGVPVGVTVAPRAVDVPTVASVSLRVMLTGGSTNRMLIREAPWSYRLSDRGRSYAALLATTADGPPEW